MSGSASIDRKDRRRVMITPEGIALPVVLASRGTRLGALLLDLLFMVIGLAVILLLMLGATSPRALVPGRLQSVAEMSYEFVANTLRSTAGTEGMRFFPLVFSLFMFILVLNVIGIIPYTFTVTSHIIITVSLALLVFVTVIVYGFWKNGLHFFRLFVPSGIPIVILPLVTFIEVLSFLSRPVSHIARPSSILASASSSGFASLARLDAIATARSAFDSASAGFLTAS